MHVGVEVTVADRLGQESYDQAVGQLRQVDPARFQRGAVTDLNPVDPFDRHDPAIGPVPIDRRDSIAFVALHGLGQFGGGGRFAPQVQLAHGPALQVGDDQARAQPSSFAAQRFKMGCSPLISLNVGRELFANARAQHLDRHGAAVGRYTLVDLSDRCGANRLFVNAGKQRVERFAKAGFNLCPDCREGHRGQAILQAEQIERRFLANQVGPGGQGLTQLDRGRTDCLKGSGIVRHARLEGTQPRQPEQPLDGRGCVAILLDSAQRAVLRQDPAPAQQSQQMGCRTGQIFQPL